MRARIQKISRYTPSIFQGKFEFSLAGHAARRGFSLTVEHPFERLALRFSLLALGAFACLYLYFIGASVLNVIARKEALSDTSRLANAVASLERDYLTTSQGIGPEDGASLGLTPVGKTVYIHRPGATAAAPAGNNEI